MADDSFYDTHQLTSMLGQLSLSLASQATERLLVKDQNAKVVFTTGCIVQFITHVRHYWCLFLLTCQEGCENTGDELFPNFWCMFFAAFMGEPSAWTCSQFVKAFSESWPLRERERVTITAKPLYHSSYLWGRLSRRRLSSHLSASFLP